LHDDDAQAAVLRDQVAHPQGTVEHAFRERVGVGGNHTVLRKSADAEAVLGRYEHCGVRGAKNAHDPVRRLELVCHCSGHAERRLVEDVLAGLAGAALPGDAHRVAARELVDQRVDRLNCRVMAPDQHPIPIRLLDLRQRQREHACDPGQHEQREPGSSQRESGQSVHAG
jgi:hypothetical protein